MKIMISGADGFVGPYLEKELVSAGHNVRALGIDDLNVCDNKRLSELLSEFKPDAFVHLAALSAYEQCREDPELTWNVNVLAVEALAKTINELCPSCTLLFVSSGKIYAPQVGAVNEESELEPADFYALTKLSADLRLSQISSELSINIISARPFNHTGPGQGLGFLCPDLISRLKNQGANKPLKLLCGSLDSVIDLTDVRDVVRAYRYLLEKKQSGVFNIGRGSTLSVQAVIDELEKIIGIEIQPEVNPEWLRPQSDIIRLADVSKIKEAVNWQCQITLRETLKDMWDAFEH